MPCTVSAPCCGVLRRFDDLTFTCGNGHHFRLAPTPVFVPPYVPPAPRAKKVRGRRPPRRGAAITIPKRIIRPRWQS